MHIRPSFMCWLHLLLISSVLQCGCNHSSPNPTTSIEDSTTSQAIVTLTPRCADELRQRMQRGSQRNILFISVKAERNCTGFLYEMDFRESPPENVILTSSEGVALAIDGDDAAFLNGTTLDYLAAPGGFKFNNPREDTSLLAEYREKSEAEARERPVLEARANLIDPELAVAELLTSRRQVAFEDLQLWWKFHQPEAASSVLPKVGRVDRYEIGKGKWITVVFTGDAEEQRGGIYLIQADGHQTPIWQGNNYVGEDDQFVDINGDGLPEIVANDSPGGTDEDNPNQYVTDATSLIILPITSEQVPLLYIVFDVRPFNAKPSWRARFVENSTRARDVVLEQQTMGEWAQQARFVWSAEKAMYEGPRGSKMDGFIASPGDIELETIKQFMKRPR